MDFLNQPDSQGKQRLSYLFLVCSFKGVAIKSSRLRAYNEPTELRESLS